MKKFICLTLVLVFLFSATVPANASTTHLGTLPYWYANQSGTYANGIVLSCNEANYFPTPVLSNGNVCTYSVQYLDVSVSASHGILCWNAISHAVNSWNNQIGLSLSHLETSLYGDPVEGNVRFIICTEDSLNENAYSVYSEIDFDTTHGTTRPRDRSAHTYTATYSSSTKSIISMSYAEVYLFDSSLTAIEQKYTATHELGHALGWQGHYDTTTDCLMRAYLPTSISSVSVDNASKLHLQQIYNLTLLRNE